MLARADLLVAAQQEQRARAQAAPASAISPTTSAVRSRRESRPAVTRCCVGGAVSRPSDGSRPATSTVAMATPTANSAALRGQRDLVRAGKVRRAAAGAAAAGRRRPAAGRAPRRPRQSAGSRRGRRAPAASGSRRARGAAPARRAAHRPRHRQAGDVGAGHQQDEAAGPHQQPDDLARAAGHLAERAARRARATRRSSGSALE